MLPVSVSTSITPPALSAQQFYHARQADLQQLGKDLGTGDVAGAEAEYQDIVNLGQSSPFKNGNAFGNPQREKDFTDIGQALQSGNLAGAQQAFDSLKGTFEKLHIEDPLRTAPPTFDHIQSTSGAFTSTSGAPAASSPYTALSVTA